MWEAVSGIGNERLALIFFVFFLGDSVMVDVIVVRDCRMWIAGVDDIVDIHGLITFFFPLLVLSLLRFLSFPSVEMIPVIIFKECFDTYFETYKFIHVARFRARELYNAQFA